MKIVEELLPGCFVIDMPSSNDERGLFIKTFHVELWRDLGISFELQEEFYSKSRKGVLRGMHFQLPPHDHAKVVYCLTGAVLDVLVDLRSGAGFGRSASIELSGADRRELFIPQGIAHGFLALADDSLMLYKTSKVHAPAFDGGIRWDSFGFEWRVTDPIVSARDRVLPALKNFVTPF